MYVPSEACALPIIFEYRKEAVYSLQISRIQQV